MSKNTDASLINEVIKKNVMKLFAIYFELKICAEKHCSQQKKNIMNDKKTADLHTNYTNEKDIKKKLELRKQYSENDLMYEYNKCVVKDCNKILNNTMKLFKSIISTVPESDLKRKELDKMIVELEKLFKKNTLTKKDHKTYIKRITELMFTIKPS